MTKASHTILGAAFASIFNWPLGIAVFGAVLPDIDVIWSFAKGKKRKGLLFSHRGITHHPFLAFIVVILGLALRNDFIFYTGCGIFIHLGADFLTPSGIPYFRYNDRVRFKLCSTGTIQEAIVVASILFLMLSIAYFFDIKIESINLGLPRRFF